MSTNQQSEFYTKEEVELLDKYGLLSHKTLDDDELYEIITRNNFNDERITNEINSFLLTIKKRGDDYEWGEVKNGKKKQTQVETKTKTKEGKSKVGHKAKRDYQKDSEAKALNEENRIHYDHNYNSSYGGYNGYSGYNGYNGYSSSSYRVGYSRGRGGYYNSYKTHNQNRNYKSRQYHDRNHDTSSDIKFEFNENGQLVAKIKESVDQSNTIKDDGSDSHVVINEIAESQASLNLNKVTSPVKEVKQEVSVNNSKNICKEQHSSPPKTRHEKVSPIKQLNKQNIQQQSQSQPQPQPQQQQTNLITSNETGFFYSSTQTPTPTQTQSHSTTNNETTSKQDQTKTIPHQQTQTQPTHPTQPQFQIPPQMGTYPFFPQFPNQPQPQFPMTMPFGFDPSMSMSGFPGLMPMFPGGMDQESIKNNQIDPKMQQQMNMNYMAMMNQMYMQMMMYKNMMNFQNQSNIEHEKK